MKLSDPLEIFESRAEKLLDNYVDEYTCMECGKKTEGELYCPDPMGYGPLLCTECLGYDPLEEYPEGFHPNTVYREDIDGMGCRGYLSVKVGSKSEKVLKRCVKDGICKELDWKCENGKTFDNSYQVMFPKHFSEFLKVYGE